ncbi:unnamed protein product [Kuraishia capsulata CBS 1993]|uniref:Precorrin-2 dehydrogenase n=1 Tax=Kuraishia capsulata CBS 1993 TaxID=1382522 RepID=W6MHF4_9ASCO|nr:uncharacterized protein KUCA_T00001065001 [Kuraishia capsulata CBS 1993]CDK25098.1 unnamed protein product [Kuraishia capsulata CBS 1993]
MTKLLVALNCRDEVHLIIGSSSLAATRIRSSLDGGAKPVLISPRLDSVGLENLVDQEREGLPNLWIQRSFQTSDLTTLGRPEVENVVDRVFVVSDDLELKNEVYQNCKRLRIPISCSDSPELCTFTMLASYTSGDFQMGVTTNGKGCHLASRIKRELTQQLPSDIAQICENIGDLRTKIRQEDNHITLPGEEDDDALQTSRLNALVPEFEMSEEQKKKQRMRWLSQIVEYYPLNKLSKVSVEDLSKAYQDSKTQTVSTGTGSISLVGSGPGSVSLLTIGALSEIHGADLILADKLVPQQVLDLIPRNTDVFIARKFPGNAEAAQQELLQMGLQALRNGLKVIRLKQGDPYIFGRGGEEYLFFKDNGFTPVVLPGITSALSAPVVSQIPATHREVADQVLICTGTGRRGVLPDLPGYVKSRTTVFLMALHRMSELAPALVARGWDPTVPLAIVERAACPDQRVVRTTLQNVVEAYEAVGSRPPGLLVVGWACQVMKPPVEAKWHVEEGCALEGLQLGSILETLKC